jgi:hypothetical protein
MAIRKVIFNHLSLNLPKTPAVIPIIRTIVILGIQTRRSPTRPAEATVASDHQRCGFQRKSTKTERPAGNVLGVAVETTKPTLLLNIHSHM